MVWFLYGRGPQRFEPLKSSTTVMQEGACTWNLGSFLMSICSYEPQPVLFSPWCLKNEILFKCLILFLLHLRSIPVPITFSKTKYWLSSGHISVGNESFQCNWTANLLGEVSEILKVCPQIGWWTSLESSFHALSNDVQHPIWGRNPDLKFAFTFS